MADLGITGLKTEVDVQIYTNHAQAITGAIMNDTLIDTIDTLKNGGNLDAKSVDTAQLADNAVEALQINTGAVTEAKIGSGAVTEAKIGTKAVTSEKLADDAVVRTFAGAVLLNPYSASLTPRRVGDIAINTTTGEIWQSTSIVNAAASWKSYNEIWDSSSFHQDLLFADEYNNIIGGFKNGHVVSKFPSPYVDNSNKDNLELTDENGNVVFSIKDGCPETKNFDGKKLSETIGTLIGDKIQTITVSVADYNNNLKMCFESISPSKNKHYIILIPEGTYDIRSYYQDHIYGEGLYVPDYVRLQGIGAKEKIILQYRNTVEEWFSSRSTLNLHEWVEMDNLTVVSQYIRYTIHADTQSNTPYQKYFKITNCSFKHYNGYYSQAWGAGLKANTLCIFENCNFFTDYVNHGDYNVTEKPVFSYHNNGYGYTSSQIVLKNCRFTNAGDGAVLAFYGINAAQSQMMYVTLVGCKLNTYVYIGEYNEGNNGPEAKITGYANVMGQDPIIDVAAPYTYSDYIDLV